MGRKNVKGVFPVCEQSIQAILFIFLIKLDLVESRNVYVAMLHQDKPEFKTQLCTSYYL